MFCQRHYFVSTVHIVKAMVFPVVMYGCESWTIKKAERQRIDAFEPWCWRRLLRVPWTARSNQSILEEINSEYSLDDWCWNWSFNTLATWCKEPIHWKKTLMLRKIEVRKRGWKRIRWLDGITDLMRWTWVWGSSGVLHSMGSQRVGHDCAIEQQQRSKVMRNVQVSLHGHRDISPSEYSWKEHLETKQSC